VARYVLPVVGSIVGFAIGGPAGAAWGWSIGGAVGSALDPQVIKGPSIGDITQQTSQEGIPRPIVFGTSQPIAGNVIATSEPRIVRTRQSQGKGGPKVETEAVYRTYAIRVCEGPIARFVRVWRNTILVYDVNDAGMVSENAKFLERARFFLGTYVQNASPDLEAVFGAGTTPAHRGTAYLVMADEDLTDLRGAIPQWQFQVSSIGAGGDLVTVYDVPGVYTWTRPELLLSLTGHVIGAGAGGGSGAVGTSNRGGGGGGGGGGRSDFEVDPETLPTTVAVTVGAGGAGGAAVNTGDLGLVGANGGASSFGAYAIAGGGVGGFWGFDAPGTSYTAPGGAGGTGTTSAGGEGGDGTAGRFVGVPAAGSSSSRGGGGGGGGGGRSPDGSSASTSGGAGDTAAENNLGGAGHNNQGTDGPPGTSTAGTAAGGGGAGGPTSPFNAGAYGEDGGSGGAGGERGGGGGGGAGAAASGLGEFSGAGGDGGDGIVVLQQSFGDPVVDLADVVEAICLRAGLDSSMFDVVELEGIPINGITVTNAYPAYSPLRALSEIFLFDSSNYDGQIHFILRGANSVATVGEDDMVLDDEEIEQSLRADSIAVPRVLHLNYFDVEGGLAPSKQTSERAGDRRSVGEVSLQTAVLMDADHAARVVTINHKVFIEDAKGELRFNLPDSWLRLVTTNPIIVQWQGRSERCRIMKCDVDDGYQSYVLNRDRQSAYTSTIEGIPPPLPTAPPSSIVGPTLIEPLDIHILRDSDDLLGYYVAISGVLPAWQGATVELSLDGGANYIEGTDGTVAAVMGETLSILADHPQAFPDEVNLVQVRIDTPNAELEDTDLEGMLNRTNLAIIGDEILQFANADETSEGMWELSTFLRGRKGTATASHDAGSRFVLLERGALPFIPAELTELGRTLTFRATSFGTDVSDATIVSMVFAGLSQTERQPAYLQAHMDGDDVVISWQGVGRLGGGATVAMGAYFVGYEVTITDGVITNTFTTIEQTLTEDVSLYASTLTIQVRQRNQITGLGPAIEVII
jgi:hypothetical protein